MPTHNKRLPGNNQYFDYIVYLTEEEKKIISEGISDAGLDHLEIFNNIQVNGTSKLSDVTINGILTVLKNTALTGNFSVAGDSTLSGILTLNSPSSLVTKDGSKGFVDLNTDQEIFGNKTFKNSLIISEVPIKYSKSSTIYSLSLPEKTGTIMITSDIQGNNGKEASEQLSEISILDKTYSIPPITSEQIKINII